MNNKNAELAIDDARTEFHKISSLIKRTKKATSPSRKYLTLYSLIKASGVIEYAFKTILADYHLGGLPQTVSYIDNNVRDSSRNPSLKNIYSLLKEFDSSWNSTFKRLLKAHPDSVRIKQSMNSLCENRNSFAHGKACTATFADIMQYFEDSVIVIQLLDAVVV